MKKGIRILVVDDEESLRDIVSQVLSEDGHEVTAVASGEEAMKAFRDHQYPFVITDIRMEGMSGIQLLQEVKKIQPETQVVIMTSHASLESAITAIRSGAYDYLIKPFEDLQLITTMAERVVDKIRLIKQNQDLLETLKKNIKELARVNSILSDLALRDGLTGLFNHRYFQETFAKELTRSRRHARALSLIFIDVDYFKQYNDTHGHVEGDQILKALAEIFKKRLRTTDVVARYGGEEFVVVLPETVKENGKKLAEKLRESVAGHAFPGGDKQPGGKVTVSLGVASFPDDGSETTTLVRFADEALYRAKKNGRNTVC